MKLFTLLAAAALVLGARAETNAPAPDAVLTRLEQKMADVRSVRAKFKETKRSPLFDSALVLRGEIGFERPARFAWKVTEPVAYQLVLADGRFMQWDAETGHVQDGSLKGNPIMGTVVDKLTGFFSGRFLALTNDFAVEVVRADPVELACEPRPGTPAAAMGQSLRIHLRADERYVEQLEIRDRQGGVTEIRMEETELNAELPAAYWKVPPRG